MRSRRLQLGVRPLGSQHERVLVQVASIPGTSKTLPGPGLPFPERHTTDLQVKLEFHSTARASLNGFERTARRIHHTSIFGMSRSPGAKHKWPPQGGHSTVITRRSYGAV